MINREELRRLLMRGASEVYLYEAAIMLLCRYCDGYWLSRVDFLRFVDLDMANDWATIDFDRAMSSLDSGELPADDEQAKILRIVASLGGVYPILLREVVEGIDRENIALVAEAIMYADGFLSSTADPKP